MYSNLNFLQNRTKENKHSLLEWKVNFLIPDYSKISEPRKSPETSVPLINSQIHQLNAALTV